MIEKEFKEIYLLYKKDLYNLALNFLHNKEDAEEIVQDVFIKVYEKYKTFKNTSSLKTWIYRITINTSLDFLRVKKRKKSLSFIYSLFDENFEFKMNNFNHPGIEIENKESIKFIFDCINKLNERQKTVILLLKIEQKTKEEVAEILKISLKALDSLFDRAKNNLEKILSESEEK